MKQATKFFPTLHISTRVNFFLKISKSIPGTLIRKTEKMSSFRRPRIKASVTHLASLAGKRRVVVNATVESQTESTG